MLSSPKDLRRVSMSVTIDLQVTTLNTIFDLEKGSAQFEILQLCCILFSQETFKQKQKSQICISSEHLGGTQAHLLAY